MSTPAMSLEQIRIAGLTALIQALGPVGMIRFLQQFETGYGDYTQDRRQRIDSWDIDTAIAKLRERQRGEPKS